MHDLFHSISLPTPAFFADVLPAEALPAVTSTGTLMLLITIFVLAVFVGVEIITKIPPTLHTPLMSGSNAISGITMVGAILESGKDGGMTATILGLIAVVLATINVVGGFVVTDRMLSMFKSKTKK
jgi:H+-translocating NAD(P) transhydrogenase subunit alpha